MKPNKKSKEFSTVCEKHIDERIFAKFNRFIINNFGDAENTLNLLNSIFTKAAAKVSVELTIYAGTTNLAEIYANQINNRTKTQFHQKLIQTIAFFNYYSYGISTKRIKPDKILSKRTEKYIKAIHSRLINHYYPNLYYRYLLQNLHTDNDFMNQCCLKYVKELFDYNEMFRLKSIEFNLISEKIFPKQENLLTEWIKVKKLIDKQQPAIICLSAGNELWENLKLGLVTFFKFENKGYTLKLNLICEDVDSHTELILRSNESALFFCPDFVSKRPPASIISYICSFFRGRKKLYHL